MLTIYTALLPIIATILLGYALKRGELFPAASWQGLEKLTYYILTPALLVQTLASKQLGLLAWRPLCLTLITVLLLCALLMTLWQRWVRPLDPASFTSLFQGGLRFNAFIALALASALFGEQGLLYGALASGAMIILINILCVAAFALAVPLARVSPRAFLKQLASNPLILACSIGLGLNLSGLGLPEAPAKTLELIGRAAFPIGLLAVGAALELRRFSQEWELTLTASLVQLLIKPLLALLLARLLGLDALATTVVVLCLAVPTAPSSYIVARQLGGNYQAMAAIITFQTLCTFVTLPATLWLLQIR